MREGTDLPGWFAEDQSRLFLRVERQLTALMPDLDDGTVKRRARTLFSAVHGIVAIGIEQKLVAFPETSIEAEIELFVRTYLAGLGPTNPTISP